MKKEDFDTVTRNGQSPSKRTKNFKDKMSKSFQLKDGEILIPDNYEHHLIRQPFKNNEDPFKALGVTKDDKMTFFLLKWVFNAIKLDSDSEDKQLKGQSFVAKNELVKQLGKNRELLTALNCKPTDLEKEVK